MINSSEPSNISTEHPTVTNRNPSTQPSLASSRNPTPSDDSSVSHHSLQIEWTRWFESFQVSINISESHVILILVALFLLACLCFFAVCFRPFGSSRNKDEELYHLPIHAIAPIEAPDERPNLKNGFSNSVTSEGGNDIMRKIWSPSLDGPALDIPQ